MKIQIRLLWIRLSHLHQVACCKQSSNNSITMSKVTKDHKEFETLNSCRAMISSWSATQFSLAWLVCLPAARIFPFGQLQSLESLGLLYILQRKALSCATRLMILWIFQKFMERAVSGASLLLGFLIKKLVLYILDKLIRSAGSCLALLRISVGHLCYLLCSFILLRKTTDWEWSIYTRSLV